MKKDGAKFVFFSKFGQVGILILLFCLIFQNLIFSITPAYAATKSWDFSNSADYTFDSDKIEVSSDQAKLKAPSDWYDPSWKYRKAITIDHTKVSADQTNFPVYVDLSSDPDLAAHAQADGDDILFTGSDGVTKLDHDLSRKTSWEQFTANGAWCWFQDPRAIHYEGTQNQTYVGWVNALGDIFIGSYNHSTKIMSRVNLHPALQVDDHAGPSILIRPDGRLMVFYSAHNDSTMYYRLSTNPEDISSWGAEQTVGTNTPGTSGYSYPNPVQLSDESNKIYLFWRGGNWEPSFSTSTDGISWSTAKTLFNVPGQRPYTKVVSDGTGKIHFTFTDGHPTDSGITSNSIYYAYYYNGAFYKAGGTFIRSMADVVAGSPLLPSEVDKVYDSAATGIIAWNWDIALDGSGYPTIVYANFPTTTDHRYRYARWTGSAWADHEITPAGGYIDGPGPNAYYSGGVTLDHENSSIVYLSREISGVHEIEKWTTSDNGATWSSESITSGSSNKNIRPVVPRGHTSELPVIWMNGDYPSYETYATALKMQPISIPSGATVSEAHVGVPNLSSSSDTEIYMYYGNSVAPDQSDTSGVWDSNFKMVQHLNNGVINSSTDDSTINYYDGDKKASGEPNEISGKINKAQNFDGSNDYINTGARMNMAGWSALTAEAWVKYEEGTKADEYTIISNLISAATTAGVNARVEPVGDYLEAYVLVQTNTTIGGSFADLHFDSNWHHLVITYDTTNGLKASLDGATSGTSYASAASLDADASSVLNIGYASKLNTTDGFKGRIDEVRISNILRSTNWLSTEYNNQNSPLTFYSVGSEVFLYDANNPTIQPTLANAQAFTSLSGFAETAAKDGGQIKYQVSNNSGSIWYWWNGSSWVTTISDYTEANTAIDINANIATFPVGSGSFLFKAYLHSDGTQLVQLDSIDLTYANDVTPPTITNITSNKANGTYGVGTVIDIDLTFSENVTTIGFATVTLNTGGFCTFVALSSITASCNYTVSAGENSADLNVSLVAGVIKNDSGTSMVDFTPATNLANNKDIIIDTTAPTISNITSSRANGTYGVGAVIDVDLTFSKNVTSTGSVAVTLDTGGSCNFTVTNSSTASCNYTVSAGENSPDLNVSLVNGTIKDGAGNSMVNFTPATNLADNKNIVIDTTIPIIPLTITNVTSTKADGTYKAGTVIDINLTFSENVTSTGSVVVTLDTGGSCNFTVSNSSTASCNYTVNAGENSPRLNVSLVSGTIKNQTGTDMTNFVPATNLANNKDIIIDTTAPTISNITSSRANGAYKAGTVIDIDLTFSESVTSTGSVTVNLDTGGSCTFTVTGLSTASCNYTISAGEHSSDLNVSLVSGTIKDQAGNAMTNFTPATNLADNKNIVIDTTAPTITNITSTKTNGTYGTGTFIDVDLTFSENVNSTGSVSVTLDTGGSCSFTVTNSNTASCNYTVSAGEHSSDLNVSLVNGTINDQASNSMTNFVPATNLADNKNIVIDTTPPVINSVNLVENQVVSGIYHINVDAIDPNFGVQKVEFYIDDVLKDTANSSPYFYDWDTTQYHSPHIVKVIAYNNIGNTTEVTYHVMVNNQLPETGSIIDKIISQMQKSWPMYLITSVFLICSLSVLFLFIRKKSLLKK